MPLRIGLKVRRRSNAGFEILVFTFRSFLSYATVPKDGRDRMHSGFAVRRCDGPEGAERATGLAAEPALRSSGELAPRHASHGRARNFVATTKSPTGV